MRALVAGILLAIVSACIANAEEWHPASREESRDLINCLIDDWLRSSDMFRSPVRWEIHIRSKNYPEFLKPQDSDMPEKVESGGRRPLLCPRGGQFDYYSKFDESGNIVLTNGRPPAGNGIIEGYSYEIMQPYRKNSVIAIFVSSGPRTWKKMSDGSECLAEPLSSADRYFFREGAHSLRHLGNLNVWIADVLIPLCVAKAFGWQTYQ